MHQLNGYISTATVPLSGKGAPSTDPFPSAHRRFPRSFLFLHCPPSSSCCCCCQGDAEARCDSRMHDLKYRLSAARCVASTISQPQSSVTAFSRTTFGSVSLDSAIQSNVGIYGRRHLSIVPHFPKINLYCRVAGQRRRMKCATSTSCTT